MYMYFQMAHASRLFTCYDLAANMFCKLTLIINSHICYVGVQRSAPICNLIIYSVIINN